MRNTILVAVSIVFLCCTTAVCSDKDNSYQTSFAEAVSISTSSTGTALNLHRVSGIVTDIDYGGRRVTINNSITINFIRNVAETREIFKESLEYGEPVTIVYERTYSLPSFSSNANANFAIGCVVCESTHVISIDYRHGMYRSTESSDGE